MSVLLLSLGILLTGFAVVLRLTVALPAISGICLTLRLITGGIVMAVMAAGTLNVLLLSPGILLTGFAVVLLLTVVLPVISVTGLTLPLITGGIVMAGMAAGTLNVLLLSSRFPGQIQARAEARVRTPARARLRPPHLRQALLRCRESECAGTKRMSAIAALSRIVLTLPLITDGTAT